MDVIYSGRTPQNPQNIVTTHNSSIAPIGVHDIESLSTLHFSNGGTQATMATFWVNTTAMVIEYGVITPTKGLHIVLNGTEYILPLVPYTPS